MNITEISDKILGSKYIAATISSVGYVDGDECKNLAGFPGFRQIPVISTNTGEQLLCNGWDIVSGRIIAGSDIIYSVFPNLKFQVMRDWTNKLDVVYNDIFCKQLENTNDCPRCGNRLTITPSSLTKICIPCYIVDSDTTTEARRRLFETDNRITDVQNKVLRGLFDDTVFLISGKSVPGILRSYAFNKGYHDENDFEIFNLFSDFDPEQMAQDICDDFTQSIVRDQLNIPYFEGIKLINKFVEDLNSDAVMSAMLPDMSVEVIGVDSSNSTEYELLGTDYLDESL